jgi:ADP-heptose:LPS heptosyltransferase
MHFNTIRRKAINAISKLKIRVQLYIGIALELCASALTDRYWLLDYLPAKPHKKQYILLVRLDLIGDFILWLDAAKELKKAYPNSHLVLYANSIWANIAEQLPFWDQVIPIDVPRLRTSLLYRLKVFIKIRSFGFDIAIQPTFSREYIGDMTTRASSAQERIGQIGNLSNITEATKSITDHWYTKLIGPNNSDHTMELQTNATFLKELVLRDFCIDVPVLPKLVTSGDRIKSKDGYIVIAPGSSWAPRAWPSSKFAALIDSIEGLNHYQIVFCGSQSERSLCAEIMAQCSIKEKIINLAGQTNLLEMIEVLRGAKLVIANESAAIHIAAATRTPAVCVTGGGHFGRFMPYKIDNNTPTPISIIAEHRVGCFGCEWHCKFQTTKESTVPCIAEIETAAVSQACMKILLA